MARLSGRVAIVTGAATGLGRETAILYAEEGARVVVADIRSQPAESTVECIRAAGGEATFVPTDVSRVDDVLAVMEKAERRYGAVHVVTANAGILGRGSGKRLERLSVPEIEEIMAVNFWGVCHTLQHALAPLRRAGGGAITVTTSLAAHYGYADLPAYAASKHAILGLVRSLAADVAPEIRVNAVSAGAMATEIGAHAAEAKGAEPGSTVAHRDPSTAHLAPAAGLIAHPRQVAYAHLFLASDEASFITGQALVVDGGRSARPAS
jgi:NAD(P)-dependent dehydrogenase (short-subunit alcohol dehydrogenase family)